MRLEALEDRQTPSAVDAGGGLVRFDAGASVSAFGPTWTGELNVVTDDAGGRVYVGGGPGAGPNLATFDLAGDRVSPDVYVGNHPESREGLVPVLVGGKSSTPAGVSFGPADGYAVFLDGADADTTREVYAYFAGVGNVRVTNQRPSLAPGRYATVLFGPLPPIPGLEPNQVVGVAGDVGAVNHPHNPFQSPTALVGPPEGSAVAAHEIGHLFGLGHVNDPGDVMNPFLGTVVGGFSAAEVRAIHDAAAAALGAR